MCIMLFKGLYLKNNILFINPIIKIISDEIDNNKNYLHECIDIINKKCCNSSVIAGDYYIRIKKSSNPRAKIKEYFNL